VLQQVEDFGDGTISANDCFKPVSRYFDRIVRPEQILDCLPRALATMLDPATCGPATLAFCQDVQAEAFDYPEASSKSASGASAAAARSARVERPDRPDQAAKRPLIVAGGGVLYARAEAALAALAYDAGLPVAETQGGKGAWPGIIREPGRVGVTGTSTANAAAEAADLIIGVGTRLQDFTTGSRALFGAEGRKLVQVNVAPHDAHKHGATSVVGDARAVIEALAERLDGWRPRTSWTSRKATGAWRAGTRSSTRPPRPTQAPLPTDAQVLGAVWRASSTTASWSAPPAACRASCTSCGAPARRAATTSNTASRAWATRSPAPSA
jgi:3D-(3,5/4)-trihydroxycyclohexane-1,2-dione acylhydrolase (decyclizing)